MENVWTLKIKMALRKVFHAYPRLSLYEVRRRAEREEKAKRILTLVTDIERFTKKRENQKEAVDEREVIQKNKTNEKLHTSTSKISIQPHHMDINASLLVWFIA